MCTSPYYVPFYTDVSGKICLDWKIARFVRTPKYLDGHFDIPNGYMSVACGKCVECLKAYSTEWAHRCMCEKKLHRDSCVLTLTYAHSTVTLVKRDYQLFLKRLRKRVNSPIRYFGCGEYGEKGSRPHFHIIIFGWKPPDMVYFFTTKKGSKMFKSAFVADVWQSCNPNAGFITVGEATEETCFYSTKYLQKLNPPPEGCLPAFTMMSRKPGIGLGFFTAESACLSSVCVDGHSFRVPRYIRRKFNCKTSLEKLRLFSKKIKLTCDV